MSDEHTHAWLNEREDDRPSASELADDESWRDEPAEEHDEPDGYEITLTVSGIKDEHAAYVASQLHTLARLFKLDGSNVETTVTAERNRDGVERIYGLLPGTAHDDEHPF